MTREEILAMEPGRELDALIAKKVMGWKYSQVSPDTTKFFCLTYGNNSGWWKAPDWRGWGCACCGDDCPPEYSTDIDHAWEVVRKMDIGDVVQGIAFECELREIGQDRIVDITPAGICKAALLAALELC